MTVIMVGCGYYEDTGSWEVSLRDSGSRVVSTVRVKADSVYNFLDLTGDEFNTVGSIGNYSFRNCKWLTGIKLLQGVKSIGMAAFSFCINLKSMIIHEGVTSIEPAAVISIGTFAFAFYECIGLTSMTIPMSMVKIQLLKSIIAFVADKTAGNA